MKEIIIKVYTLEELKEINKNTFNKIINENIENVREIEMDVFQDDFREFKRIFTEITEIHIDYNRNGYPILYYDDNWTSDIKGVRFFGKLQKILKQLKENNMYHDYIMLELINKIEDHISRIPKYLIENDTLLEYLSNRLNELYNDLSFEAWDVSTEDIVDYIENKQADYNFMFTESGEQIYI